MRNGKPVITIFGSAFPARGNPGYEIAYDLGLRLAKDGFVVCNGGYGGIMEASARGARDSGGLTLGVITRFYAGKPANTWISEIIETPTPIDRLLRLLQEGDGYVILPGGTGTLLELAAVWEMLNKKILDSRPAVLLGGFWQNLVSQVSTELVREGRPSASHLILEAASPAACVEIMNNHFKGRQ